MTKDEMLAEMFANRSRELLAKADSLNLRDACALGAMQAAMTRGPLPLSAKEMVALARDCYHMADAMLQARSAP